jgi:hypothetical protein
MGMKIPPVSTNKAEREESDLKKGLFFFISAGAVTFAFGSIFELFHTFTKALHQFRDLFTTEKQKHDDQDDDHFRTAKAKNAKKNII